MMIKVFPSSETTSSKQYASVLQTLAAIGSSVMMQDVVLLALIAIRNEFVKSEIFVTVRNPVESLK